MHPRGRANTEEKNTRKTVVVLHQPHVVDDLEQRIGHTPTGTPDLNTLVLSQFYGHILLDTLYLAHL